MHFRFSWKRKVAGPILFCPIVALRSAAWQEEEKVPGIARDGISPERVKQAKNLFVSPFQGLSPRGLT